ncbi:hypothetical protein Ddc_10125 [Ditylenchus destructor]|nr:hypothetical protein Ddc_10125 [Ditylenchus destructor]
MLLLLPIEIKTSILEELDRKDLYNLRCVNHNLNDIIVSQFDNKPPYVTYWVLEILGKETQNTYNLCEFEYRRKGCTTLLEERSKTFRILKNKYTNKCGGLTTVRVRNGFGENANVTSPDSDSGTDSVKRGPSPKDSVIFDRAHWARPSEIFELF